MTVSKILGGGSQQPGERDSDCFGNTVPAEAGVTVNTYN